MTKLKVTPEDNPTSKSLKAGGEKNIANLKRLKGAAFDKAYIDNEVAYHQAVLDAVDKTLIPDASNEELKALLVKVRPAFVAHLEHAKKSRPRSSRTAMRFAVRRRGAGARCSAAWPGRGGGGAPAGDAYGGHRGTALSPDGPHRHGGRLDRVGEQGSVPAHRDGAGSRLRLPRHRGGQVVDVHARRRGGLRLRLHLHPTMKGTLRVR